MEKLLSEFMGEVKNQKKRVETLTAMQKTITDIVMAAILNGDTLENVQKSLNVTLVSS